MACLCWR